MKRCSIKKKSLLNFYSLYKVTINTWAIMLTFFLASIYLGNFNDRASAQTIIKNKQNSCPSLANAKIESTEYWEIPPTTGIISPKSTRFCIYKIVNKEYVLIESYYNSSAELRKANLALGKASNSFIYLGVPSGFYRDKPLIKGSIINGKVISDDCGAYDNQIIGERCPDGYALAYLKDNSIDILTYWYSKNLNSSRIIPKEYLKGINKE